MDFVTATQLRTMPNDIFRALEEGITIDLVRKSKIVGEIRPKAHDPKPFDPILFSKAISDLKLPKLSYKKLEIDYNKHLIDKYGQDIS